MQGNGIDKIIKYSIEIELKNRDSSWENEGKSLIKSNLDKEAK